MFVMESEHLAVDAADRVWLRGLIPGRICIGRISDDYFHWKHCMGPLPWWLPGEWDQLRIRWSESRVRLMNTLDRAEWEFLRGVGLV